MPFIFSFCLIICVWVYILGKSAIFPGLQEVVLFRRCLTGLRSEIPPDHQSLMFQACPLVSCVCPPLMAEPWLLLSCMLLYRVDPKLAVEPSHGARVSRVLTSVCPPHKMVPTSAGISWGCKNGSCQCLSLYGASQLIPASLADSSRLVSGFCSPQVHVIFNLVFLYWLKVQVSLRVSLFEWVFCSLQYYRFFWTYSSLVFKVRCFGGLSLLCRI